MRPTIYLQSPGGAVVPIRHGFSWPAFFFGPLWAVVKRAYALAVVLMLAAGALGVLRTQVAGSESWLAVAALLVAHFGVMLASGIGGNSWAMRNLKAKGYVDMQRPAPNQSMERTASGVLRTPTASAHLQR